MAMAPSKNPTKNTASTALSNQHGLAAPHEMGAGAHMEQMRACTG